VGGGGNWDNCATCLATTTGWMLRCWMASKKMRFGKASVDCGEQGSELGSTAGGAGVGLVSWVGVVRNTPETQSGRVVGSLGQPGSSHQHGENLGMKQFPSLLGMKGGDIVLLMRLSFRYLTCLSSLGFHSISYLVWVDVLALRVVAQKTETETSKESSKATSISWASSLL